ncbi:hypothetical protein [Flavitalea sp.]|nr:hypothetical protein [Flavitalea sp.]
MSRFKKATFILYFILMGLAGFSQEQDPLDTMLIIDSAHQVIEAPFYDDSDFPESAPSARSSIQPQVPDTLIFRKVADSITARLKKQKDFEYANDPAYWVRKPLKPSNNSISLWQKLADFFSRPAVRGFIYLLLFGLAIFLIIKVIIVNNLYIFKSSPKKKKVNATGDEATLMEENLDELIRDALEVNDQRAVVRFHYLKTLKLLDKKGWISFHPQSTNQNYRSQVNNYAKGKEFGFLSSAYEHVWYGNFQLNREQFEIVLHSFNHFQNSLKV